MNAASIWLEAWRFTWLGIFIGESRPWHLPASLSGLIGMGQRVTWRAKHFGRWQSLTSEITAMDRPNYFQDAMIEGAFRFMKHDHIFRPLSAGETEMKDVFSFAAPVPVVGRLVEILFCAGTCGSAARKKRSYQADRGVGGLAEISAV